MKAETAFLLVWFFGPALIAALSLLVLGAPITESLKAFGVLFVGIVFLSFIGLR